MKWIKSHENVVEEEERKVARLLGHRGKQSIFVLSNKGRINCIYQNNFLLSPVKGESLPELSWQERGNDMNYRIRR